MISIYGIFSAGKCIYIGQTINPKARRAQHVTRFGRNISFRVFRKVSIKSALPVEQMFIKKYKAAGEAAFNGHCESAHVRLSQRSVEKLNKIVKRTHRSLTIETNLAIDQYKPRSIYSDNGK